MNFSNLQENAFMKSLVSTFFMLILFTLNISTAHSMTPKEYLEETRDGLRGNYVFGVLETAMIINTKAGRPEKSDCIKDWFAEHADEANKELNGTLHKVKDKDFPVAAVILLLIERHCGKLKTE